MVAPNGARRTIADHPAIPITIEQIVTTAASCYEAGAGAMHFVVRDNEQHEKYKNKFINLLNIYKIVPFFNTIELFCLLSHFRVFPQQLVCRVL